MELRSDKSPRWDRQGQGGRVERGEQFRRCERAAWSVHLLFVLIMLCMGRDWNRTANAPGMRGRGDFSSRCVVLAVLLDTNDAAAEAVCESSLERASESSGRSRDTDIVCWFFERHRTSDRRDMQQDHDM